MFRFNALSYSEIKRRLQCTPYGDGTCPGEIRRTGAGEVRCAAGKYRSQIAGCGSRGGDAAVSGQWCNKPSARRFPARCRALRVCRQAFTAVKYGCTSGEKFFGKRCERGIAERFVSYPQKEKRVIINGLSLACRGRSRRPGLRLLLAVYQYIRRYFIAYGSVERCLRHR